MLKRLFDVTIAALSLVLLGPLFLILTMIIKLDSPGPGFYRAPRIGKDGKLFYMFKLRTMVQNADRLGPRVTYRADPRITRIGALLRDLRLDELPQIINVLRGEMSLVGPRPESPEYVERYTTEQRQLLAIKPGITGPMQIAFLDEEEALAGVETLDDDYVSTILPAKLAVEWDYLQKQSLRYDLKILIQTVWVLLSRPFRSRPLVLAKR